MQSISDPFDSAALTDEKLPEYFQEYSTRRTEEDEWAGIKKYFDTMCADIERFSLETKEQALEGIRLADDPEMGSDFKYKHESMVPFRKTDDQPMLEDQFRTAQSLISKVRAAIEARTMTFDFMRDWGLLCYASGYVMCTWFARDSDDLASARGGRRSATSRRKDRHRIAVARLMVKYWIDDKTRKEAEELVVDEIQAAIASNTPIPPLEVAELPELLNGNILKRTYHETKLTRSDLNALAHGEGNPFPSKP